MKNGTRIFLICLIIVLLLGYVIGFVYCTVNKYASAEEIQNDDSQILNFNQLFNIVSVQEGVRKDNSYTFSNVSYTSGYYPCTITPISFVSGYKYYLKGSNDYRLYFDGGTTHQFNEEIFIPNSDLISNRIFTNTYTLGTFSFQVICLSTMFGVGNEPNLQECQNLFITNYEYTTGTPINLNSFIAYNEGMNYILNSISTSVLNFGAFSSAYIYKNLDSEGYIDKYIDYEVYSTPYFLFKGYLAVPLNRTVKAGEIIEFTYADPGMGGAGGDYLWAGILYNDSFVPVSVVEEGVKFSFVCPFDTQIFMLSVSSSTERFEYFNVGKWVGDFTVSGAQIDLDALIQASVEGYKNEMQDYYANYYGRYGEGYAAIYDVGKADGITEANTNMNVMQYMKTAFITIGEILMIEVFPNFTLGSFFMLPIITSAIFFVIKIAKGGGD